MSVVSASAKVKPFVFRNRVNQFVILRGARHCCGFFRKEAGCLLEKRLLWRSMASPIFCLAVCVFLTILARKRRESALVTSEVGAQSQTENLSVGRETHVHICGTWKAILVAQMGSLSPNEDARVLRNVGNVLVHFLFWQVSGYGVIHLKKCH